MLIRGTNIKHKAGSYLLLKHFKGIRLFRKGVIIWGETHH